MGTYGNFGDRTVDTIFEDSGSKIKDSNKKSDPQGLKGFIDKHPSTQNKIQDRDEIGRSNSKNAPELQNKFIRERKPERGSMFSPQVQEETEGLHLSMGEPSQAPLVSTRNEDIVPDTNLFEQLPKKDNSSKIYSKGEKLKNLFTFKNKIFHVYPVVFFF